MTKPVHDEIRTPPDDAQCLWCRSPDHKTIACPGVRDWLLGRSTPPAPVSSAPGPVVAAELALRLLRLQVERLPGERRGRCDRSDCALRGCIAPANCIEDERVIEHCHVLDLIDHLLAATS